MSAKTPAAGAVRNPPPTPWDLSCRDWRDRIREGRSLVPQLPLDLAAAARATRIFKQLKLPDVPGTPPLGQAGGPWFFEIVAALAGSIDATGARNIRQILAMVPKKNAKSTNAAGLVLTLMLVNRRPRAEFLLVGPTQTISEICYNQAEGMVQADEFLAAKFHVQRHIKRLSFRGSASVPPSSVQVRTFDPAIITGAKPIGTVIDELHELGKLSAAERVIGQIGGGMVPFPEAFLVMITTQSDEPPAGVFAAELLAARMIRDGAAPSNGLLPVLYEFPTDPETGDVALDWRDPANWWMVNPNMGRSVTVERLEQDWNDAKLRGEREIKRWASQHLNVEIGLALASHAWEGAYYWERNADSGVTLEAIFDQCEVVTVGIDGGGLDDLLGLSILGRIRGSVRAGDGQTGDGGNVGQPPSAAAGRADDGPPGMRGPSEGPAAARSDGVDLPGPPLTRGRWLHWAHAWCFRGVLELRKDIASRLTDFAADGDLTIIDRIGDDVEAVADLVKRVHDLGLLPDKAGIGVDPAGIGEIVEALAARGIDATPEGGVIVGIPQGWKLNGAIKTTARKLAGGDLKHGGSRLMAWSVGNAKVEPRGNAISITKQASGTAKIDPLMALFDAAALMAMNPGPVEVDAHMIILESA